MIQSVATSGLLDSGGGIVQFPATVIAAYLADHDFDAHVGRLQHAYRQRRDALLSALAQMAPNCVVNTPAGGFFVWVRIPGSIDLDALHACAEAAGVSFIRGTRFCAGDVTAGRNYIRLCFAMLVPEQQREGARRLAAALRSVTEST
jgi:2-aminoadipate transaminase